MAPFRAESGAVDSRIVIDTDTVTGGVIVGPLAMMRVTFVQ